MSRSSGGKSHSVHDRLLALAKRRGEEFQFILDRYAKASTSR